ncbi:MAG: putative metalloprotease CJM1_0395 family protein [Desulfohalobiaceae bacterium]
MQSTPVPPDIVGGAYPPAAGQKSSGQDQGPQVNAVSSSRADSSMDSSPSKQAPDSKEASSQDNPPSSDQELSEAEKARLRKLQQRDREVRAHEQAHMAAGGPYVQGGADLKLRMGPDGQFYAVGGEVSMDASEVPGDPEATMDKARTLRRAALAPARPSAQDLQVAALAAEMILEARQELRQETEAEDPSPGQKDSSPSSETKENLAQPEQAPAVKSRALAVYNQQQVGFGHAL